MPPRATARFARARNRYCRLQWSKSNMQVFFRVIYTIKVTLCWADCVFLCLLQVFDCLQHRELNVTVLSDSSVAEYKTADYLCYSSAPFLRSLHTSAFSGQPVCQSLEQPNIVTGLPAAGTTIFFSFFFTLLVSLILVSQTCIPWGPLARLFFLSSLTFFKHTQKNKNTLKPHNLAFLF